MIHRGLFTRPGALIAIIVAVVTALVVANTSHSATPFPDAATARFSVTVTGEGPDLILIPGLASSAAVWDGTVARFKGHYRLHVLNLAGFAGEPAAANASGDIIAPSVDAIAAYIRTQGLNKPVVVGHSMGGLMALMLAKSHPDSAGKLIVVDALPYAGLIFNPNATVAAMTPQVTAMRDGLMAAPAEAYAAQQRSSAARLVSKPGDVDTVAGWSATSDRRVFAQSFFEDMMIDLRPELSSIATPTVVIVPVATAFGQTTDATMAFYKAAYAGQPNITFVPVDNSLHFVMLDQPDAFATALETALK